MDLIQLGWCPAFESDFIPHREAGFVAARVAAEHRDRYVVFHQDGQGGAEIAGRLRFAAGSRLDFPAVGDWVALQLNGDAAAIIHAVLPRRSTFLRKAAGEITEPQVVAANLDTIFIVTDSDRDFNPRRMERYLTLAQESGAAPVIVINKTDLCPLTGEKTRAAVAIAAGAPVVAVSATTGSGLDPLRALAGVGRTIALIGSSGVGKSTLINRLLGEVRLATSAVREDDGRGRHTTTSRQLLLLPSGGVVIDTPGMREVQLWAEGESLGAVFQDIDSLAAQCRFSDCRHASEPGCAVKAALEDGSLPRERYESYLKLRREIGFLERKQDVRLRLAEQARWKRIHRAAQEQMKSKYGQA